MDIHEPSDLETRFSSRSSWSASYTATSQTTSGPIRLTHAFESDVKALSDGKPPPIAGDAVLSSRLA